MQLLVHTKNNGWTSVITLLLYASYFTFGTCYQILSRSLHKKEVKEHFNTMLSMFFSLMPIGIGHIATARDLFLTRAKEIYWYCMIVPAINYREILQVSNNSTCHAACYLSFHILCFRYYKLTLTHHSQKWSKNTGGFVWHFSGPDGLCFIINVHRIPIYKYKYIIGYEKGALHHYLNYEDRIHTVNVFGLTVQGLCIYNTYVDIYICFVMCTIIISNSVSVLFVLLTIIDTSINNFRYHWHEHLLKFAFISSPTAAVHFGPSWQKSRWPWQGSESIWR